MPWRGGASSYQGSVYVPPLPTVSWKIRKRLTELSELSRVSRHNLQRTTWLLLEANDQRSSSLTCEL